MSQVKAGAAYVELLTRDSKLRKGLLDAQRRLQTWAASVRTAGLRMFAGGASVVASLVAAATRFASIGDTIAKMADRTGASVESLSTLKFAAEQSGASLAELATGMRQMQRTIGDALGGNGAAINTLRAIGMNAQQLADMTPDEQLRAFADRLKGIENPALRNAAAMRVFGRAATQLLPMLAAGGDEIADLQQEARDLGLELSPEDAKSAVELTDAFNRLRRSAEAIVFAIGSAVAPAIRSIVDPIARILAATSAWVSKNRALFVRLLAIGAVVMAVGAALLAASAALALLGLAAGGAATIVSVVVASMVAVKAVILAILSPIGIAIVLVVGLGAAFLHFSGVASSAVDWLMKRFGGLVDYVGRSVGAMAKALVAGDFTAAADVLWASLELAWAKGVSVISGIWERLQSAWIQSTFFLSDAWTVLTAALAKAWNSTVAYLHSAWANFANFLAATWRSLEIAWLETTGFIMDAWDVITSGIRKAWDSTVGHVEKAIARLKWLNNSDFDIEAEVTRIDSRRDDIDAQRDARIAAREQARREARDRIRNDGGAANSRIEAAAKKWEEAQAKNAAVDGKRNRELLASDQARRAALNELPGQQDKAAERLRLATEKWEAAIAAAPTEFKIPDKKEDEKNRFEFDQQLRAVETKSTFQAAAIRGLGADTIADRQSALLARIAANTEPIEDIANNPGAVFQ